MKSASAPLASGSSGADLDAVIAAEAVSKRYPGRPVTIFPPVVSIFDRRVGSFRGGRLPEDGAANPIASSYAADDYDMDDEDDEDELDRDTVPEPAAPPAAPDEMVWALREISLRVPRGAAIGIVGGPGAGKSTLLRILAGRAFPTEGRVFVRGQVAPLASAVVKALALSAKVGGLDIVPALRLLGVDGRLAKRHRGAIHQLAGPLRTPDGDPARGARLRLAVAASVVLPADVILLDDPGSLDDGFMARVGERLRERVRAGDSLVFASRDPSLVRDLCDEVILLRDGSIVERGGAAQIVAGYDAAVNGDGGGKRTGAVPASARGRSLLEGQEPRVPRLIPTFNGSAALLSAEIQTADGTPSKRFDARDELNVEIRLETATPETEVRCGVCFTPRSGGSGATGFRVELPEPLRIGRPRAYRLLARVPPGMLPSTAYQVRADAIVASVAEPDVTVIARAAGRVRIQGGELDFVEPADPPAACWEGHAAWPIEAEWSVTREPRRR